MTAGTARDRAKLIIESLADALEGLPLAAAVAHDPACARLTMNRVGREALDVSPGQNVSISAPLEARASAFRHFVGAAELAPEAAPLQQAVLHDRVVGPILVAVERWDGQLVRTRIVAAPVHDPDGVVIGGVAMMLDVARPSDLKALEPFDSVLAEALPQLIWVTDAAGATVYFNRRWFDYTGQTAAEALGLEGWTRAVHPEDRERAAAAFARAVVSGSVYEVEYRLLGADGVARWFLARGLPLRDGDDRVIYWVGTSTDIDARKRLEAALEESTASFRALAETLPQLVWASYDGLLPHYLNGAWATYTGVPLDTLYVGDAIWTLLHRDDVRASTQHWEAARVRGTRYETEFRLRAADGSYRWFLARATPVTAANGSGVHWFGTCTDIEEKKQREHELADRYERERNLALILQEAHLPAHLPTRDGIALSATYAAAAREALVGGDWYDAFVAGDRLVLTIGDVCGHGTESISLMGELRHALRGIAHVVDDPARMLAALDGVIASRRDERFATCVIASYDPRGRRLRYAVAGHPRPLLRDPHGGVRALDGAGLPLGLAGGKREPARSIEIAPGSTLLFYTDGLIEEDRDAGTGERALLAAVAAPDFGAGPDAAGSLKSALVPARGRDDVALLVAHFADDTG